MKAVLGHLEVLFTQTDARERCLNNIFLKGDSKNRIFCQRPILETVFLRGKKLETVLFES